jgi:hypothetical protein
VSYRSGDTSKPGKLGITGRLRRNLSPASTSFRSTGPWAIALQFSRRKLNSHKSERNDECVLESAAQGCFACFDVDCSGTSSSAFYECKPELNEKYASQARALTWQFREPIATLVADGKSNGRHYAGPSWDYILFGGLRVFAKK